MITTENKKTGWLDRLKSGLHRTRMNIIGLFTGGKIDDDFLEELEFALISADMGVSTVGELLTKLRDTIQMKGLKTQEEVREALFALARKGRLIKPQGLNKRDVEK